MKMVVAADQAKLALSNVEGYASTKLGTKQLTENHLKNVCVQIKNNEICILDFLMAVSHNIRKQNY